MSAKHLILGLDGVDLDLVRAMGEERLPTLHRLMAEGSYAHLESVVPPATLPNWTTFLTGLDPGAHGVFDFTTRDDYRVAFTAGSVREAPTLFARLHKLGLRTACVGSAAAAFGPGRNSVVHSRKALRESWNQGDDCAVRKNFRHQRRRDEPD